MPGLPACMADRQLITYLGDIPKPNVLIPLSTRYKLIPTLIYQLCPSAILPRQVKRIEQREDDHEG